MSPGLYSVFRQLQQPLQMLADFFWAGVVLLPQLIAGCVLLGGVVLSYAAMEAAALKQPQCAGVLADLERTGAGRKWAQVLQLFEPGLVERARQFAAARHPVAAGGQAVVDEGAEQRADRAQCECAQRNVRVIALQVVPLGFVFGWAIVSFSRRRGGAQ